MWTFMEREIYIQYYNNISGIKSQQDRNKRRNSSSTGLNCGEWFSLKALFVKVQ